jgi:protein-ribulosamine 3-kinase
MIPTEVTEWLDENDFGDVRNTQRVSGGCINNGLRLETSSGHSFFLKTNRRTPQDMFAREAEGLNALCVEDGPRVPEPYVHGPTFLLLEDLQPANHGQDYWPTFGRLLACLHSHNHSEFGFEHDNYIGSNPQPNPWTENGYEFFAEQRLGFQAEMARGRGLLGRQEVCQVEALSRRLPELVPEQPASLIHGDLWSGNATSDSQGAPAIIDPATYFGWAEAELAMTALFGAFPGDFYSAYQEVWPLEPGFQERFPIYNLYHLLNHLNLFGGSYLSQVTSILRRFQ